MWLVLYWVRIVVHAISGYLVGIIRMHMRIRMDIILGGIGGGIYHIDTCQGVIIGLGEKEFKDLIFIMML